MWKATIDLYTNIYIISATSRCIYYVNDHLLETGVVKMKVVIGMGWLEPG